MSKRIEVLPSVLGDLALRVSKGARQYGEPLTTRNGRDALQDAYEEALDLALYLKQAMLERRAPLGDQPAASETPADPRRTVGAVVYDTADDGHRIPGDLIVVADGGGQKYLDDVGRKGFAGPDESDRFSRWATRAECERHGIPYVERDAKPASPAASETPAAKFKVGDRVRVKRLSFHEGVGVDWPTRTKGYKVGNEFDVAWASPDGDKVDRMDGSGQYLFADELELVHPAAPARSERPTTPAPRDEAKDVFARLDDETYAVGEAHKAFVAECETTGIASWKPHLIYRQGYLAGLRARDGGR